MLQEALEKSTYSPAEVALMLTSFVESELPAGGASAEKRFFELFPTLCERIFGPISPNDYRHEIGGWLSRERRWDYQTSTSTSKPPSRHFSPISSKSPTIRSDPVVLLLGTGRKSKALKDGSPLILIDAFAKEAEHRQNVRYDFAFLALPKSMQDDWLSMIQIDFKGAWAPESLRPSDNSVRLFGSLFRASPRKQLHLLAYQQTKAQAKDQTQRRPLQLNPLFSSPNTVRSPGTPILGLKSPVTQKGDSPPKALLSMLEFYMLVFIRYPLFPPDLKAGPTTSSTLGRSSIGRSSLGNIGASRKSEPYGNRVYRELFSEYVSYYIYIGSPNGPFRGFQELDRPSELFLRLTVALWLEAHSKLVSTAKACVSLQERHGSNVSLDLCASYDLVKASATNVKLQDQVLRCLHMLINRVIIDPNLAHFSEYISRDLNGRENKLLCLSPSMDILQQPFYNHVRNVFRNAPIHTDSTFSTTLSAWLMWLEPWNTQCTSNKTSVRKAIARASNDNVSNLPYFVFQKASHGSKYTPMWEAYIASNLHFYTVPLALFLRRARELDLSPKTYKTSLETVMKVLRVYSKDVVAVIDRLLGNRGNGEAKSSSSSNLPYAAMVANHEKKLGVFAPPATSLSLSSLRADMQNLLEEIYFQHVKNAENTDAFSKFFDRVENALGTGTQHQEVNDLEVLTEKAKIIFGFPSDFEVSFLLKKRSQATERMTKDGDMLQTSDGFFTDVGLQFIKCRPEDIKYVGDKMNSRPQSYEIQFLVPILIKLSTSLNAKLNLDHGPTRDALLPQRINLRFLADWRNLIFVGLMLWLILGPLLR